MARRVRCDSYFDDAYREASMHPSREDQAPRIWRGPLRVQHGVLCTFSRTEDPRKEGAPKQKKVIDYNFAAVCRWGGILGMLADASVIRGSGYLLLLIVVLSIVTGVVVHMTTTDQAPAPDPVVVDSAVQRITIIVTFVLGFFVSANVERWWHHRTFVRQLHSAILDVLLCVSSAGVAKEHLWEIARLGLLSQALLFEETRGTFDRDGAAVPDGPARVTVVPVELPEGLAREASQPLAFNPGPAGAQEPPPSPRERLVQTFAATLRLGLTNLHEAGYLAGKRSKAQVVWVWMARYVMALHQSDELGCLDSYGVMHLQEKFSHGRTAISCIMTQLNTQLPFTYVQLVAMMVQFSHLVIALCCGRAASIALQQKQYVVFASQILQVLLIPLTFQSLLDVCVLINDPYGSDVLDFSFLQLHIQLADQCEAFVSTPPPAVLQGRPLGSNASQRSVSNSPRTSVRHLAVPSVEQAPGEGFTKGDVHLKLPSWRVPCSDDSS